MALEGQQRVVPNHAASIVGDLDKSFATGLNLNFDSRRTGIQRIFQKFFNHRRRTLHHLASSNLVGNVLGKNVDLAHKFSGRCSSE